MGKGNKVGRGVGWLVDDWGCHLLGAATTGLLGVGWFVIGFQCCLGHHPQAVGVAWALQLLTCQECDGAVVFSECYLAAVVAQCGEC